MLYCPGRNPAAHHGFVTLALVMVLASGGLVADEVKDLEIFGWVENVHLLEPEMTLKAKLDTGAETSSLDAVVIKKFRKGGKRWVRFQIENTKTGEMITVVRERVRTVGIIQHFGDNQTRPVVKMSFCISGQIMDSEVSLVERSQFNYPLLLGRNTLGKFALIDPGNTFLSRDDCDSVTMEQETGS